MKHRKARKKSVKEFWCPVHKKKIGGFQRGGHARVCKARLTVVTPAKEKPYRRPGIPISIVEHRVFGNPPVMEATKATGADRVVKTVRSYLAAIDEDLAKNESLLKDLTIKIGAVRVKIGELKVERERIVSSLRELK